MAALALALNLTGFQAGASESHFSGIASVYSDDYSDRTASGEPYDPRQYTAAHPTLPFGTLLHVTNPRNGRSIMVVVNDRGPFVEGRVLDLSQAAARALGMAEPGILAVVAQVRTSKPIPLRVLFTETPPR